MDIADRIANKEYLLSSKQNFYNLLIRVGQTRLAEETKQSMEELKKSIAEDRKIQLTEAQTSGRKTWKEDAWKYALVIIGTAIVIEIVRFIFANL